MAPRAVLPRAGWEPRWHDRKGACTATLCRQDARCAFAPRPTVPELARMTDAPENNDDRAPEGDDRSDTDTTTKVTEPAPEANGSPTSPAEPEVKEEVPPPAAEATPDGPVSEAVAESDAQPEAAGPEPERPAIGPVIIAQAPPPGTEEPSTSRRTRGGGGRRRWSPGWPGR